MTYSLLARGEDGAFGVVTASRFLAVGATVPAVAAGVGALVTQAHTNPSYREDGMALLAAGAGATEVVSRLVEADPGRRLRQLGVLDAQGTAAFWTGELVTEVAAERVGDGCLAVGNIMAGRDVLDAMLGTFQAATGPLSERLLLALSAGEQAGGDRRGRQSAALVVQRPGDPATLRSGDRVDLRVDDHPEPVEELRRLLELHRLVMLGPRPQDAAALAGPVADEVELLLRAVGQVRGTLEERLAVWAEQENVEHRLLPGLIDLAVLDRLRVRAGVIRQSPG
ncbi:MAG TPA: DUF1028 domain-containing protein [Actinotalea sp.]|nr:DUF1028 domain-containing protein [Actinotalea sp.]